MTPPNEVLVWAFDDILGTDDGTGVIGAQKSNQARNLVRLGWALVAEQSAAKVNDAKSGKIPDLCHGPWPPKNNSTANQTNADSDDVPAVWPHPFDRPQPE